MAVPGPNELFIKNPHSILPVLESRPRDVLEVNLPKESTDEAWVQIEKVAQRNNVKVNGARAGVSVQDSRHAQGKKPAKHSSKSFVGRESSHGALIRPKQGISIEKMFEGIDESSRGVWLALDTLQDPQNMGAIFRSAGFFGVKGIIMTAERSVPMTSTVYDIASGGVESVPFVSVINLQRAFEAAKESGLWILGTSEHAKESIYQIKNDRAWLVVMGNEEKGLRRLTQETCDMMCTIPTAQGAGVTSLNVSVATGIMLSCLTR